MPAPLTASSRTTATRQILHEAIRRVLPQVHATCSLNQQSTDFLDVQVRTLRICARQSTLTFVWCSRSFLQLIQVCCRLAETSFTSLTELRDKLAQLLPDELATYVSKAGEDVRHRRLLLGLPCC